MRLIAKLGFGEFSGEIPEGEELVDVQILVSAGISSGSLELDTISLIDVTDVYEIASAPAQEAINTAREAQEIVQAMRDKGENFIINGSFENGYEGWPTFSGNRRFKETEDARTGNFVYEIDARSTSSYTVNHSDLYPTLEEATYYVEIWARKNDDSQDGSVILAINETYSASSRIDFLEVPSSELPYDEWARVRGYVTIPEGWKAVRFAFGSNGPSYYFDDLFVADVTEAYQARQTADQAMTMAGTKNTVTYSDGPPVGIGQTVGDTHRQRDGSGNIEAEWSWDGADWVPQQITSEAITNLDVGKLTAGSAAIDDLVAQRIGAATGEFIELATDQLIASDAGFDTAVANQMFVDIFTANQVTANEIDVNSIASHSAFVEDLFSQNIGVSGELIASSGNFSTILSQYGLQTFSHQSLVEGSTWNLGNLNIYSNYPPSVQRIGDHIYYTVNDGTVLRKYSLSSNSVVSSLDLPYRAIRGIYSDGVSRLVMSLLPSGSSTMQIVVVNTNNMSISNSFNLDLADRSVDAIHPDGTILGWYGPFAGQPVLYDLNGNELRRFNFEDVTGRMAMNDDYIFAANTVISPGHLPTVVQFDKNTGQEVHRYVGTYAYFLGVSDDIVWIVPGLNQDDQHPMYGYDINTHNPRAVVMLPNDGRDTNAVIWENGRINKVSADDWVSDVNLLESFSLDVGELERVSIDNITGSLTAVEANIRSLEVDEIRADPENIDFRVGIIRPRLDQPAVLGAINNFNSIAEADAFFDSHIASRVDGTEILVDGVKYVWRWDSPSSQTGRWVPANEHIIGKRLGTVNRTFAGGQVVLYDGFSSSGDTFTGNIEPVSNYGIRILEEGWYRLDGSMRFDVASQTLQVRLYSSANSGLKVESLPNAGGGSAFSITSLNYLTVGDVVDLRVYSSVNNASRIWSSFPDTVALSAQKL